MNDKSLPIKIFLSLALFTAVAMQVDYTQLRSVAENIHPFSWLLAGFFMLAQMSWLAMRWKLLVNAGRNPGKHPGKHGAMRYTTSLKIVSVSSLANYVFITSLGGIIARITLSTRSGFPFVKALAATTIDRGMTFLALALLSLIFIPVFGHSHHPDFLGGRVFTALVVLAAAGIAALFLLYHHRRAIIFMNRKITLCAGYLRGLASDPVLLLRIVGVSLAAQAMYFAAVYSVMRPMGGDFSFLQFMAVMPLITLTASLPVGYGGWGVREGAFVLGLHLIGLSAEAAFITSVQIGIISMITAALAGIPAFIDDETQSAIRAWKTRKRFSFARG